jgi:beta-lactamase regulating signal transducer with metallopeptidase domain
MIDAIAYALLASLWQGAIASSVAALVIIVLRQQRPQVRYIVACAGLAIMVAMPVVTAVSALDDLTAKRERPPISARTTAPQMRVDERQFPAKSESLTTYRGASPSTQRPFPPLKWSTVAVFVWATGAIVFALRLLRSWIVVERLRRDAVRPVADRWRTRMEHLAQRLQVGRPVKFVQSNLVDVPMVIGWLRPMILMPVCAFSGLTSSQLDAIIAHEVAHIRRHDFAVNLLQAITEAILFYHPCTWWLSRQIRTEREFCCDDIAARICEDRQVYAQALVELEQLRQTPALLGVGASHGPLERRIRRILGRPTADEHRSAAWVAAALVLAVVTITGRTAYMQVENTAGILQGQVVDAATAQAIQGASVTIVQRGDLKTVLSDTNGRYEISNLAAGEYRVIASAPGYVPTAYGQRFATEEGAPVEIQPGRMASGIDVRLQRSAAVHGRIFDIAGNGLSGVEVEILAERYRPGGTALAPVGFARTDDLGAYRIGDLTPGTYYVRAYVPGSARAAGPHEVYASTYLPGSTDRDHAQPIALSGGQELFGADMTLATARTVTVTGVLIDPEHLSFQRTTVTLRSSSSRTAQAVQVTKDGEFRFSDVVPGKYFLVVQEPRCERGDPPCDAIALRSSDRWAGMVGMFEPLDIDRDVSGIRLVAGRGARLEGRIVVDPPSPPLDLHRLRVTAVRHVGAQANVTESQTMFSSGFVSGNGTFAIDHVSGERVTLEVESLPEDWSVKSVRVGQRDVTDQPMDFGEGNVQSVEIVITNRLTQLFGHASDSRGNAVSTYTVVVFPEDQDRRRVPSRLVRAIRSGNDALYEIRGLPSGRYLAIAINSLPMNAWNDPNVLERLARSGTPFQLDDGERHALNLRLSEAPPNVPGQ